ncbi:rod shape-determining protein MreD [Clostridium sporogenes]|uniref:Rod shape-determining protein MreD n=1 Tax=Clostridium botulinum TaxID=1491 RepID=A0A6M0SZJ3_CLOBO|nr:rod shape-determining protein MreD [Clostridium sporogenes]NFA60563.1 rod shape-determining protein MreD [Clostridium botulinum]NFI73965.1 rod shape-determining protein MreD [Clostridium sporogenes]NFL72737.1 rod shape-determining protein MreD [Clostridium sporogenes]NFM23816.1 rod shape-determining protein MreD [Clostridium sporogenes]NFP61839.1 rod shape-determining protein MreD [Clostridium sporogenes]
MKKNLILGAILILLAILDNSLMPFMAIKGVYPSLLFVFIVSYSIIKDKWEAIWVSVFAGILQDLYFTNVFGINSLINMLACLIAAEIGLNIIRSKILIPVISSFLLSIFKGAFIWTIAYFLKMNISYNLIAFNSIYNGVITIIVYKLVYNLCKKRHMDRKWEF